MSGTRRAAVWWALMWALATVVIGVPGPVLADVHGVPLPRGSRAEPGAPSPFYRSTRSFRQTRRYYQRWLKRRTTPHREVPTYAYRGVVVSRFVSQSLGTKWLAIHVFRLGGQTRITVVPRAAQAGHETLDEAPK